MNLKHALSLNLTLTLGALAALPAHAQYSVAFKSPANQAVVDCNKAIPMSGSYSAPNTKVAITINDKAATRPTSTSFAYSMTQLNGKRTVTAKLFDTSVAPSVLKAQNSITIACQSDLVAYAVSIASPAANATVDCGKPIPVKGSFTAPQSKVAVRVNGVAATISGTGYSYSLAQLYGKRTVNVELLDTSVSPAAVRNTKSITIACSSDAPAPTPQPTPTPTPEPTPTPTPTPEPSTGANFTPPATTEPWAVNQTTHEYWIIPKNGNPVQALTEVVGRLNQRTDTQNTWTVYLGAGDYTTASQLRWDNLQKVNLLSDPANPAVFRKPTSGTSPEYIAQCRNCRNVKIDGLTFYGRTMFATSVDPVWGDQGLFMASTHSCTVSHNRFFNFGNAALRMTTHYNDPIKPVNSFDNITEDNHFENVYQVTTTADNTIDHGGTSNYIARRNTFKNLRGSFKFATRVKEAQGIYVRDNSIDHCDNIGIEVSGYTDKVEITGNTIKGVAKYGISIYTNDRVKKGEEYEWGNNYIIRGNNFATSAGGIHFNNGPYTGYSYIDANGKIAFANYAPSDYIQFMAHNLTIDGNSFDSMTGRLINLKWVDGASLTNNRITNNKFSELVYLNPYTVHVTQSGNTMDGKPVTLLTQ